jgi:hypothetical protein
MHVVFPKRVSILYRNARYRVQVDQLTSHAIPRRKRDERMRWMPETRSQGPAQRQHEIYTSHHSWNHLNAGNHRELSSDDHFVLIPAQMMYRIGRFPAWNGKVQSQLQDTSITVLETGTKGPQSIKYGVTSAKEKVSGMHGSVWCRQRSICRLVCWSKSGEGGFRWRVE